MRDRVNIFSIKRREKDKVLERIHLIVVNSELVSTLLLRLLKNLLRLAACVRVALRVYVWKL